MCMRNGFETFIIVSFRTLSIIPRQNKVRAVPRTGSLLPLRLARKRVKPTRLAPIRTDFKVHDLKCNILLSESYRIGFKQTVMASAGAGDAESAQSCTKTTYST